MSSPTNLTKKIDEFTRLSDEKKETLKKLVYAYRKYGREHCITRALCFQVGYLKVKMNFIIHPCGQKDFYELIRRHGGRDC